MRHTPKLPSSVWAEIVRKTCALTLATALLSLLLSHLILSTFSGGLDLVGMLAALIIPTVFAGPMIFWLSLRNAELHEVCRLLENAASRDSLTGCLNHGTFVARVKAALTAPGMTGALLVVDADYFKSINDTYGHEIGDLALQHIAERILNTVSHNDLVGRVGGEEFAVFLPNATRWRAAETAEMIREAISATEHTFDDVTCRLSVSIGGATFQQRTTFQDIFRVADRQLYRVKNTGRDAVDIVALEAFQPISEPLAQAS